MLSGRPAFTQYTMTIPWKGERDLELLYTAEGAEMLGELRHQIQIAQGRSPREATHELAHLCAAYRARRVLPVVGSLVWVNDWPNYKMASPSDLGPAFWKFRWLFLEYGWDTLWRTVAGLVLSVFVGVLIGMVMG